MPRPGSRRPGEVALVGVLGEELGPGLDQTGLLEDVAGGRDPRLALLVAPGSDAADSSAIRPRTRSSVTGVPSSVTAACRSHCHSCMREISTVAASSIRLSMATAPAPPIQAVRYSRLTRTLVRTPSRLISPSVAPRSVSCRRRRRHVVALLVQLVHPLAEHLGERSEASVDQPRMSDPGPVEPGRRLPRLVGRGLLQGGRRRLRIAPAGHERGHPADGVGPTGVTGLDQQVGVRGHERRSHRDVAPVGQHVIGRIGEVLDHREDVVPAAGVQSGGVVAQFVQDLLHLERRRGGFDQAGRPDGSVRDRRAAAARR